jgi:hypothetical protein
MDYEQEVNYIWWKYKKGHLSAKEANDEVVNLTNKYRRIIK